MLGSPYFFTYLLPTHLVFWLTPFSQHSQLGCLWLPTPDCYRTPYHALGQQVLPTPALTSSLTLPWAIARFLDPFYTFSPAHCRVIRDFVPTQPLPREAVDFPRGERYFEHVSPLTYLIYLSPKEVYL